jgi:MFS family permease
LPPLHHAGIEEVSKKYMVRTRFFYGYIIVLVTFVMMVLGWGILQIYGVFFESLTQEFSWSRAVTSGAFSVSVMVSGILGIIAGRISDRVGPGKVIAFCTIILAAGYILMAVIHSTWQFYLLYGIIIAAGVSGYWGPPLALIAHWFVTRRGLMTGLVTGGISFGTLVLPPVITRLIGAYGWRGTFIIIGVAILVLMMIGAQFLRSNPQQMGLLPYGSSKVPSNQSAVAPGFSFNEAIRTRQFWMLSVIYLCFGCVHFSMMVHIVPYATGMGFSSIGAAIILSIIGGVSLGSRVVIGSLADRLRARTAAVICLAIITAAMIWLQLAHSLGSLYVFAVILGLGYGGLSCVQSLLAVEMFGLGIVGVITAIFSFSFNLGGSIGPVIAGYVFDVDGSYHWAFLSGILIIAVALVIGLALKQPKK